MINSIKVFFVVLFSFCIFIIQTNIYAQSINLGIKGGLSVPQLSGGNTDQSQGYKTRVGPNFGVFGNMILPSNFSLQLEVFYASQGGKKTGIQSFDASTIPMLPPGTYYANFSNEAVLNYLEIPLIAKYSFNFTSLFNTYVDAGPYIGFLLNAKTITKGTSLIYTDKNGTPFEGAPSVNFDQSTNITNDIKTVNTGITGGIGISRPILNGEVILDIRGAIGLTNIQKNSINGKNNTGGLVVTVGYSYNIL